MIGFYDTEACPAMTGLSSTVASGMCSSCAVTVCWIGFGSLLKGTDTGHSVND